MSIEETDFNRYMEGVFGRYSSNGVQWSDYVGLIASDTSDEYSELRSKIRLMRNLAHFYYFMCLPEKDSDVVRDELRIVAITSLMEAHSGIDNNTYEHKTPIEFYESEWSKNLGASERNKISDFESFKKD